MRTFPFEGLPFSFIFLLKHLLLKVCSTGAFSSTFEGFIFFSFTITMPLACALVNYPTARTGPLEGFYLFSFTAHMLSLLEGLSCMPAFLSTKELISNATDLLALRGRVYYPHWG